MSERTESKAVECSCDVYLRLLSFYPKAHREEYGPAMLQLFRDQCRDAWTARRTRGLIVCWLRVLPDLLSTSVLEHLSNLNWRKSMLLRSQFRPVAVFLSIFAAVFFLTVLTSALIAFLIPNSYRSTAQITVLEDRPGSRSGPTYDPYFLQTEFKVIQSHVVLSNAVEALNLREVWGKKFNNGQPLKESDTEAIIRRNLELQPIRNTKIIDVSAFSDNPDEAARLANGIVQAYRVYRADMAQVLETLPNDPMKPRARMVTIIQPAVPELRPARPNRPLIILVGLMLGSIFGSIAGAVSVGIVTFFGRTRNPTTRTASTLQPSHDS